MEIKKKKKKKKRHKRDTKYTLGHKHAYLQFDACPHGFGLLFQTPPTTVADERKRRKSLN